MQGIPGHWPISSRPGLSPRSLPGVSGWQRAERSGVCPLSTAQWSRSKRQSPLSGAIGNSIAPWFFSGETGGQRYWRRWVFFRDFKDVLRARWEKHGDVMIIQLVWPISNGYGGIKPNVSYGHIVVSIAWDVHNLWWVSFCIFLLFGGSIGNILPKKIGEGRGTHAAKSDDDTNRVTNQLSHFVS